MSNKIRARKHIANKPTPAQSEKPSNSGQSTTTMGHLDAYEDRHGAPAFDDASDELEYWKERALRAEAEIERLRHVARTVDTMVRGGSFADGIYESWELAPEATRPEILDGLLDALGQIDDCCRPFARSGNRDRSQLRKELRRFRVLRCSRQNQKAVLPLTLSKWLLKRVKAHAAIQGRSVNNFIWYALWDAVEKGSKITTLNTDSLNVRQIESLRARAKYLRSKGIGQHARPERN